MLSNITMILRGYTLEEVDLVAQVLTGSRYVKNMEITLNSDDPYTIIKAISEKYGSVLNVGAGTVQTYDELVKAHEAGATFALSPKMMTQEMLDYCKENKIISVPGSFTPTEISDSLTMGADIVKVFPANELSYNYAKKVCEPMGDLPLMAVGGVNKDNVKEVLSSGYKYVGTAGGLFKKEDIKALDKEALVKSLTEFEQQLD